MQSGLLRINTVRRRSSSLPDMHGLPQIWPRHIRKGLTAISILHSEPQKRYVAKRFAEHHGQNERRKTMRVLVTGGAGYIGSHTAKALAKAGHEPLVLDNLSSGHRWAVKWGRLLDWDLADTEMLPQFLEKEHVEAVLHFAASLLVGESVQEPRKYFWNNVVNTLRLLDAMLEAGVKRIVFSSSAAVYGNPQKVPIPEDHPQATGESLRRNQAGDGTRPPVVRKRL